jgi:hypothetical protein
MTLQTFYRRLRREDPARWMVEETGHIRRDDGHCPRFSTAPLKATPDSAER